MFTKLRDSISIGSRTPKTTPPASAAPSRPSSPNRTPAASRPSSPVSRPAARSSVSSTSTPLSSRRASLSEMNNNFTGTNFHGPARNNFAGLSPPLPVNNFTGTGSKTSAPRNNFFGMDTALSNGFGMMDPQGTRNNFPGDS